jgi:hypothetical protein
VSMVFYPGPGPTVDHRPMRTVLGGGRGCWAAPARQIAQTGRSLEAGGGAVAGASRDRRLQCLSSRLAYVHGLVGMLAQRGGRNDCIAGRGAVVAAGDWSDNRSGTAPAAVDCCGWTGPQRPVGPLRAQPPSGRQHVLRTSVSPLSRADRATLDCDCR